MAAQWLPWVGNGCIVFSHLFCYRFVNEKVDCGCRNSFHEF